MGIDSLYDYIAYIDTMVDNCMLEIEKMEKEIKKLQKQTRKLTKQLKTHNHANN